MQEGSRVALVHDFLVDVRGAERVFLALCDLFPQADLFTAVYDEEGTEGRFAHRYGAHVLPAAPASQRAHLPDPAAALSGRDGVARPARLRPRDLELERVGARRHPRRGRGARLLLPQPVPLRVERAPGDARGARPARARGARRRLPALAPVGLDRRPARRRLRRQLADDQAARGALLRPRGHRPAPAGGRRALRAGRAGRRLRRALRADGAQAHRGRRAGLQRAAPAADWWSATAPTRGGCTAWPDRPWLHRPRQRRRGRAHPGARPRARRHGHRGVRDRRRRGPGRRAARDRPARGRRARDGDRGRDRRLLRRARARGPRRGRRSPSTRWPSTRPRAWPAPGASTPPSSAAGCDPSVELALDGLGSRRAARRRPPRRARGLARPV